MGVIGLNFTKMLVEKKKPFSGKIEISNNVSIKDVGPAEMQLKDQGAIKFTFSFESLYKPDLGMIELKGELIFLEKKEKTEKILEEWKSTKKVSKEVMEPVINTILTRCNIEALILSKESNMPPPVQLPKIKANI